MSFGFMLFGFMSPSSKCYRGLCRLGSYRSGFVIRVYVVEVSGIWVYVVVRHMPLGFM